MSTVLHPARQVAGGDAAPHAAPHPTPRAAAVLGEQFRAVGVAARGEMMLVCVLMLAVTVLMVMYHVNAGSGDFEPFNLSVPVVFLGLFAPLAVWKGDAPAQRGYLWTLPVPRPRNTLAKLLGGWAWLMVLAVGLLLWSAATTLVANGRVGNVLSLEGEPWMLLLPLTGCTLAYLFASAIVLASDHPWRWAAGGCFGVAMLMQLAEVMRLTRLDRVLTNVMAGRYGLIVAATGVVEKPVRGAGGAIEMRLVPDQQAWLVATLLWGAITLAAVLAAAYCHQER